MRHRRVVWQVGVPQQQPAAQSMSGLHAEAAAAFPRQATAPQELLQQTAIRPTFQPSSPETPPLQNAAASVLLRPARKPSSPEPPPLQQDGSHRIASFGRPDILPPQERAPQEIAPQPAPQQALQQALQPATLFVSGAAAGARGGIGL